MEQKNEMNLNSIDEIINTRHYIFIDPNDVYNSSKNDVFKTIKEFHNSKYRSGEIIKYYHYDDIVSLLEKYDIELRDLFLQLNYNYPALLADIGRYVILYFNGGVYHDLKYVSNSNMNIFLKEKIKEGVKIIGEICPEDHSRVRNTNIISLCKEHFIFNDVLQKIKELLIKNKHLCGSRHVWNIGSFTYIKIIHENENKEIIKTHLKNIFLYFYMDVYRMNIKRWQETEESIFRV